jgi:hypothetical protein
MRTLIFDWGNYIVHRFFKQQASYLFPSLALKKNGAEDEVKCLFAIKNSPAQD